MKRIESFSVDHLKLRRGLYVSRRDHMDNHTMTTFDIRMKVPNKEPVMNTAEVHAIEHLGATYLRNHLAYDVKTIYFGPMGCRTGFYVIFKGDLKPRDILEIMIEMFEFIRDFHDKVPGASPVECGNCLDMNLPMAKYEADKFLEEVLYIIGENQMIYPE